MNISKRDLIRAQLEALEQKPYGELKVQYHLLIGDKVPKRLSHTLLKLALAYEIQRQNHKTLVTRVHRKLDRLASVDGGTNKSVAVQHTMKRGGRLVREWHGKTYEVYVAQDGVYMNGKRYKSLSTIAYSITGAKWNGPRFFGLRSPRTQLQPKLQHGVRG